MNKTHKIVIRRPIIPSLHSFTLLELLIVIGILAILAGITFVVLNPIEVLKSSRDAERMSELKTLNTALSLYEVEYSTGNFGTSSVVYLSLPDANQNCSSWSLPTLPSGYTYHCQPSETYLKTDGTGWVPINFKSLSTGSPVSVLPTDPKNNQSYYYTYTSGGSWEMTTALESTKYKLGGQSDKTSTDGGTKLHLFEVGNNLSLYPLDNGDSSLVGYWSFNEGTGTTTYDRSGNNNTGTLTNEPTWTTGKVGSALSFDGSNDSVTVPDAPSFDLEGDFTLGAWIYWNSHKNYGTLLHKGSGGTGVTFNYVLWMYDTNIIFLIADGVNSQSVSVTVASGYIDTGKWHHLVGRRDNTRIKIYVDGVQRADGARTINQKANAYVLSLVHGSYSPDAKIDEVRIYNRALSDSEIQAIYNATK